MRFFFPCLMLTGLLDVLCAGDSLTVDNGYAEQLAKIVDGKGSVTVAAKSGIRSWAITKKLEDALEGGVAPTHVVWFGGVNDCLAEGTIGARGMDRKVRDSICDAVRLADEYGFHLILVKHYPWLDSRYSDDGKPWMCSSRVNEHIEKIAGEYDFVSAVETWDLGSAEKRLLSRYDSGDGLHLNARGYRLLARKVYKALEDAHP